MLGYIIAFIGVLLYAVGAPSKSGRRGEWTVQLTWLGILTLIIGSIISGVLEGVITGVIVLVGAFILALFLNSLKN